MEKNNYKSKILNKLADSASGLTITELSNRVKIHRNTTSKYLSILEAESLVTKKDIGKARLYFSKKRKYLRKNLVNSFIQALLHALKNKYPNDEKIFKEVGLGILDDFHFSLGDAYIKQLEKVKGNFDAKTYLTLFEELYNSLDFFQDDLDISIVELNQNKVIYRIKNSEYLENSGDYTYYFYIVCGITEGIYLRNLDVKVLCNVEKTHITNNNEDSFIDISLEIQ